MVWSFYAIDWTIGLTKYQASVFTDCRKLKRGNVKCYFLIGMGDMLIKTTFSCYQYSSQGSGILLVKNHTT